METESHSIIYTVEDTWDCIVRYKQYEAYKLGEKTDYGTVVIFLFNGYYNSFIILLQLMKVITDLIVSMRGLRGIRATLESVNHKRRSLHLLIKQRLQ